MQSCPPVPVPRGPTPINPPEPVEKQEAEKSETTTPNIPWRVQEKEFRDTMEQLFARLYDY